MSFDYVVLNYGQELFKLFFFKKVRWRPVRFWQTGYII